MLQTTPLRLISFINALLVFGVNSQSPSIMAAYSYRIQEREADCCVNQLEHDGDEVCNPIFKEMECTIVECMESCDAEHDEFGRPCVAFEWGDTKSGGQMDQNYVDTVQKECRLAWGCDFHEPNGKNKSLIERVTSPPTGDPTREPIEREDLIIVLTNDPTIDPTDDPTDDPTADPSADPSVDPSVDPTFDPTSNPTNDPSPGPTSNPTPGPTTNPTPGPTTNPSPGPTTNPSPVPSTDPTTRPSTFEPTTEPTDYCIGVKGGVPSPSGLTCCLADCGTCAGTGCSSRLNQTAGPTADSINNCCESNIQISGLSCDDHDPPCAIYSGDYDCSRGILSESGQTCCDSQCIDEDGNEQCGGSGCSGLPGGSSSCCEAVIKATNSSCYYNEAPCAFYEDPFCDHGILSETGEICCDSGCIDEDGDPQCGGSGCSGLPGGSSNCCGSPIANSEKSCNQNWAPCVMETYNIGYSDVFAWLGFDRFEWYYTAERWMIEMVLGVMAFLSMICTSCCILQCLYQKVYCGKRRVYEKVRMESECEMSECERMALNS